MLALRGFDIHDAEIYTRSDGVAVEVFRVIGHHGSVSDERWARIRSDVVRRAARRPRSRHRARRRSRRRHVGAANSGAATRTTRVVVDNDASDANTVVEVHTQDRLGLLRLITKTLAEAGCDLSLAKVATYGVQVVDVFYVRDLEGRKITDPEHIQRVERSLTAALAAGGLS